jgi:hypothetical protein
LTSLVRVLPASYADTIAPLAHARFQFLERFVEVEPVPYSNPIDGDRARQAALAEASAAHIFGARLGRAFAAGISSGALFRSVNRHGKVGERLTDQSVSDIVKEHAEGLRLDPTQFAGHSLRAGFLTSAAARGASNFKMMDVSRHRSVDTLRGYVRDAELFKDHAGAGLL